MRLEKAKRERHADKHDDEDDDGDLEEADEAEAEDDKVAGETTAQGSYSVFLLCPVQCMIIESTVSLCSLYSCQMNCPSGVCM